MNTLKNRMIKRVMAAVLAVVMILGAMPSASWEVFAATDINTDMITITVTDENGAVEDAEVAFSVNSLINGNDYIADTVFTDNTGRAAIMPSADYVEGDLSLTAIISKEGYITDDTTIIDIPITADNQDFGVTLLSSLITDVNIPENIELTYNGNPQEAILVDGTQQGDIITYEMKKEEDITYVDYGETVPTVIDAGTYSVIVTVKRVGYDDLVKTVTTTVQKADTELIFDNYSGTGSSVELTGELPYTQTYDFQATDTTGISNGGINYSVELSEEGIASIDSNGTLTVEYPGTITVIATLAGDNNWNASETRYILEVSGNVNAQGQYISFAEQRVSYILGTSDTISDLQAVKKSNRIKGSISYVADNVPGISCDSVSGKLTVTDYEILAEEIRKNNGSLNVTVTATKAAQGAYGVDTVSYIVGIEFAPTPASPYVLDGTKGQINGTETGWYISDVTVMPTMSDVYDIAISSPYNFTGQGVFKNQGTEPRYVYLKDKATGGITDKILVDIAIDTVAPVIDFTYDANGQKVVYKVTEQNFRAEDIVVTGTITDIKGNAVNDISTSDITEALRNPDAWKRVGDSNTYMFKSDSYKNGFYDLAIDYTDVAGLKAVSNEPETFMIDYDAPAGVKIEYSKSLLDTILEKTTLGFYKPSVTVTFTAYDFYSGVDYFIWSYMQSSGTSTVNTPIESMVNQKVVAVQDLVDKSKFTAEITLSASDAAQLRGYIQASATDCAGNSGNIVTDEGYVCVVDTKKPTINVGYSQEASSDNSTNSIYYDSNAVVTLRINEANFFAEDVKITVAKNGGVPYEVKAAWSDESTDIHVGRYTLTDDGTYVINVEYTDRAGNKMDNFSSPYIVVDTTAPSMDITYNDTVKQEGTISYYSGNVEASITVNEVNFIANDVQVMVSKDGGGAYTVTPNWSSNGSNVHVGTFALAEDGDYIITVRYVDQADNAMPTYTSEQMTIDTQIEKPIITINGKEENGQAYKDELVPTINFTDQNYENYEVSLTRTSYGNKDVDVTEKFIGDAIAINENGGSGTFDKFDMIAENDGIYTLNVKMTDKAGHESENTVTFTANRFGSVYEYNGYLVSLIENGGAYVTAVTEDLVITEYNADKLLGESLNIEITRDGKPLDDIQYDVSQVINDQVTVGNSGWYQYEYTISKDNFVLDGVYKISISSKDATGNEPENSNYEDKNILFRVDNAAPEITSITGLEEEVVNAQEVTVRYAVYDTIGLKSVKVFVDDKLVDKEITDFSADLNNYEGNFVLRENPEAQRIRIEVEDLAGNVTNTDAEEFSSEYVFNKSVIVSTNFIVRLAANKVVIWGTIGGVVALAGICVGIIAMKRKKNKK